MRKSLWVIEGEERIRYLGQPRALAYSTACSSPSRKAACLPGTAPRPISPFSRSPAERTGLSLWVGPPPPLPCPGPHRAPGGVLISTSCSPASRAARASTSGGSVYGQPTSAALKPERPAARSRAARPGSSGNNHDTLAEKRSGAMTAGARPWGRVQGRGKAEAGGRRGRLGGRVRISRSARRG